MLITDMVLIYHVFAQQNKINTQSYLWHSKLFTCIQEVLNIPPTFGHTQLWLLEGLWTESVISNRTTKQAIYVLVLHAQYLPTHVN